MKIKLLIMLLALVQLVFAQNEKSLKANIPFSLVENETILLEVTIKGKPLIFYFDTGASISLIDKNVAQQLGIVSNNAAQVAGTSGSTNFQIAEHQKLTIQNIEMDTVSLVIDDLSRLNNSFGVKFDGIIGYDILKRYITAIDFDLKQIHLYPFNTTLNLNGYTPHQFDFFAGSIPMMKAGFKLKNGKEYNGSILFDSGAALSLSVNAPFVAQNKLIEQSEKVFSSTSNGLTNKSVTQQIAIDRFTFADHNFDHLPISLSSAKTGINANPDVLGILGNKIINRFNYVLNYQSKTLYLKRNSLYPLPFDFPVSGIKLSANEKGEVYIREISDKSAYYQAGIREADILISIDDQVGTLFYFKNRLKQENKDIKIKVKQQEAVKEFTVKAKKLI